MKGILFKPWKAKAISESSPDFVWQTRRLSGLEELNKEPDDWVLSGTRFDGWVFGKAKTEQIITLKPRFQVGDIVYIKEAYMVDKEYDSLKPSEIPKIGNTVSIWYWVDGNHYVDKVSAGAGRVRSPMFMPAWAARYFIKIKGVRYERLQEINQRRHDEVLAEGYPFIYDVNSLNESPVKTFARYWDSINPQHPWASNPWIAVYSFVKVEKPI